jgi:NitT/TauT family transport system permease protein
MMSMAGGWFFLMINEAFVLGRHDFRLPGLGAYMSVAVAEGNVNAQLWAMVAMVLMIVALDQVLWRPLVVWSQRFRVEETAQADEASSWMLDWLRRSRIVAALGRRLARAERPRPAPRPAIERTLVAAPSPWPGIVSAGAFLALLAVLGYGVVQLLRLLARVSPGEWASIVLGALMTLGRVAVSTALGTLWAVPAGLAIGLSRRLSRMLQPVVQVAASFPAPMLYPIVIAMLHQFGVPLGWGSILLMLLGTQWYILFNVIAGATAIPTDLREAARSYRITGFDRLRRVYLPAVFPFLVTGWVTAAGGAWNASVVAEFVTFREHVQSAWGVGSEISRAAERADFPALAAGVLVLSTLVVLLNRTVWRTCYRLAAERYSLAR